MILSSPNIEINDNLAIVFITYLPTFKRYLSTFWDSLSQEEKNKAERFVNDSLTERYILSHGFLRDLLSYYCNIKPNQITYHFNPFGKPHLDNKQKLQFNMSHSKDYAAYIIALNHAVGIDIEWQNQDTDYKDLIEDILDEEELLHFNKLDKDERFHTFYEIWTKKESIIKALGTGLSYPLKNINIIHDSRYTHFSLGQKETFYYSSFSIIPNYSLATTITHPLKIRVIKAP